MTNFVKATSADPDEMPHYAAFYLGLHYMPKYQSRGVPVYKGLTIVSFKGNWFNVKMKKANKQCLR